MAKANKKTKKSSAKAQGKAQLRLENQYYDNGKPRLIFEVDAQGNGVAKFYNEKGVLGSERKVKNHKLSMSRVKIYETDADGHQLESDCELVNDKIRLLVSFSEGQLKDACIFDSQAISVVPWAHFDAEGKVRYEEFRCDYDLLPAFVLSDEAFADFVASPEYAPELQELKEALTEEGSEHSKAMLENEEALQQLLRHNLNLNESLFSAEDLQSLIVTQFKACCEGEEQRRKDGVKATLRLFQDAIPALASVK